MPDWDHDAVIYHLFPLGFSKLYEAQRGNAYISVAPHGVHGFTVDLLTSDKLAENIGGVMPVGITGDVCIIRREVVPVL